MLGYLIVLSLIPAAILSAYLSYRIKKQKRKQFLKQTHEMFN